MAEVSKEIQEQAYDAVEKAKKSGKIKKGTNEVTKVVERGTAKLVLVAKDVNPPEVTMHLKPLCEEKGIPIVEIPSKEDLGVRAGLKISCVAIAIVQEGDAKNLIKNIAENLK